MAGVAASSGGFQRALSNASWHLRRIIRIHCLKKERRKQAESCNVLLCCSAAKYMWYLRQLCGVPTCSTWHDSLLRIRATHFSLPRNLAPTSLLFDSLSLPLTLTQIYSAAHTYESVFVFSDFPDTSPAESPHRPGTSMFHARRNRHQTTRSI